MTDGPAVVARGEGWLVAYKPAGVLLDADPSAEADTFRSALAASLGIPFTGCHPHTRIDRPVAGLTLWSLERPARQALVAATRDGRLRKLYLALVAGPGAPAAGTTELQREPRGSPWRTRAGRPLPRPPRTRVTRLAECGRTTLLAAGITAGKWHQIRLHLAGAGFPVAGDRRHGGTPRLTRSDGAVLAAPVVALECVGIELPSGGRATRVLEPPRGFVRQGAAWVGFAERELEREALESAWRAVWGGET